MSALTRNLAEVIHDLYRDGAAPRDRERLISLVEHQVRHAYRLGFKAAAGRWPSDDEQAAYDKSRDIRNRS